MVGEEEVTGVPMNAVGDAARAFREDDEYKVLIVASKFQTGFDEPRLVARYVDKILSDVATVQTLSRLNPMHPGKNAPMAIDFVNSPESVQKDWLAPIPREPFAGIGKLEPLMYGTKGSWSRRITDEHRLIYLVDGDDLVLLQTR